MNLLHEFHLEITTYYVHLLHVIDMWVHDKNYYKQIVIINKYRYISKIIHIQIQ
jgi:hypothetical protein